MKRRGRMTRERAQRMARASWTPEARRNRREGLNEETLLEEEIRRAAADSKGKVLRVVTARNECTGEVVKIEVRKGTVRVNQYCVNGQDGLCRRQMAYAVLEAIGL